MLITFLLVLTFVAAILDWLAVWKKWQTLEYIAKPATMILLFSWMALNSCFSQPPYLWFGLGVLFSLVGDVFLIFSDRWFIAGLAAFLLAQLSYIIGFNVPPPDVSLLWSLAMAVVLALSAARILRRIVAGLESKGLRRLIIPVVVYGMVITSMLLSALLTLSRLDWKTNSALLASLGATLFFASDIVLAWNRFVAPIKNGRLINMVSYHLGQIALIAGVVSQFGPLPIS